MLQEGELSANESISPSNFPTESAPDVFFLTTNILKFFYSP